MPTCDECKKPFTWTHGNQRMHPECARARQKAREAKRQEQLVADRRSSPKPPRRAITPKRPLLDPWFLCALPDMRAELARQCDSVDATQFKVWARNPTDLSTSLSSCKRPTRRNA